MSIFSLFFFQNDERRAHEGGYIPVPTLMRKDKVPSQARTAQRRWKGEKARVLASEVDSIQDRG